MKALAQIGAALSFAFFFLGGIMILTKVDSRAPDAVIGTVLGLILLGIAFFVGPLLWLAAEKWCPKQNGK